MSQVRTNLQTHAPTCGPYSTQNTPLHRGHPRQQETRPIPSRHHGKGREKHSTQLTFTDGWTALCSICSSTHSWSRSGNIHNLYTSFTFCQVTSDNCLSWRLVLLGTLWGSFPLRMLTWGQAGAGVEAGGLGEQKKQNRQLPWQWLRS